jgi:hypothetical protein
MPSWPGAGGVRTGGINMAQAAAAVREELADPEAARCVTPPGFAFRPTSPGGPVPYADWYTACSNA